MSLTLPREQVQANSKCFGGEHARRSFVEQAIEQILRVQMQQLGGGERARQCGNVFPCGIVQLLFGQALQQQAADVVVVCGEGDVGLQLFAAGHVVHQHIGDAAAFQRHHALPRLAVLGCTVSTNTRVVAEKLG